MSNLLYWVIPCAIVAIVGIFMALRERRPQAPEMSVDAFSRSISAMSSMRAIRPDGERNQAV